MIDREECEVCEGQGEIHGGSLEWGCDMEECHNCHGAGYIEPPQAVNQE